MWQKWTTTGVAGAAFGAAITYLTDPQSGRRRRTILRDKSMKAVKLARKSASRYGRDAKNRATGVIAFLRTMVKDDHPSSEVLEARVRTRLGRLVPDPGAIKVECPSGKPGTVILKGDVLATDSEKLYQEVRRVRGVDSVEFLMAVHDSAHSVSSLQGAREFKEAL